MPAEIKKRKDGNYVVITPGGVKARGTTLRNAKAQQRLLNAIEHGFKPSKAYSKTLKY